MRSINLLSSFLATLAVIDTETPEKNSGAVIQARAGWARSVNATSVLYRQICFYIQRWMRAFFARKSFSLYS